MLRKIIVLSWLASLALIAAITISCGNSSSSNSTACTGGPYDVVGNWQVNLTSSGGSDTFYGAIDSAGLALAFDNNSAQLSTGDTLELPTLTGACSFSGTATAYAEPSGIVQSPLSLTASGNVASAASITGSYSGPATGTFTAATFKPLTGSVTALSGTVTGEGEGAPNGMPVLYPFTFTPTAVGTNSNMSFTTSAALSPTCTVSGTFTQVTTANVFQRLHHLCRHHLRPHRHFHRPRVREQYRLLRLNHYRHRRRTLSLRRHPRLFQHVRHGILGSGTLTWRALIF